MCVLPLYIEILLLGTNEMHSLAISANNYSILGPWWWSRGQCAHLVLQRSEFESREVYSIYSVKLLEKNENKQKESGMVHFKENLIKSFWQIY